ncbi:MAG: penicillin-binding protein 2 [Myxococcaceae bacterium]|nr:penicillin-binding protein 2 [Myxococcaceae bacterium]
MIKLGQKSDAKDLRPRIIGVGVFFVVGLLVLSINLYRLMVVRYEEFNALSVDNQFKDVRLRAPRGLIRDRRGEVLVDARPSLDVFITPAFCQKCAAEVIPRLAEVLQWDEEQRARVEALVKAAHGPQRYQPLIASVDISREAFDQLLARQFLLPGVDLEPVPHRSYRAGPTLAHILGYMNEITQDELTRLNGSAERPPYALGDYIGRRGVERSFEHELRGTDGWVKHVVNARGEVMRDARGNVLRGGQSVSPAPGRNVVLSLDARLQAEAERAFPGTAGAVIAIETKTGFIRAIVSRPAFDPNEMTGRVSPKRLGQLNQDPLQPMVFRAGAEHYHPGSTFKLVTLLAALQAGTVTPSSQVGCNGGYTLGSRRWRCHNERGHGLVDAKRAVQVSCDTYFYRASDQLGIDPIATMGKAFGLGAITNLGVAAEVPGVMPDSAYHHKVTPGGYTKGMALNTAIGQGDVNVTPLQLAVLYSAIGNKGRVLQPQIVQRLESPDGKTLEAFSAKLVREIPMTDDQHRLLIDALISVVNEPGGTATRIRSNEYTIAGKTGTAQVARLGQVRLKKEQMDYFERDHAWFASFAPAEDPELTVVVLNEHGGHGGSDAAPTAAAVFAKYFELKKADSFALGEEWIPPRPPKPVLFAKPAAAPPEVSEPGLAGDVPPPPETTVQASPPAPGGGQ